MSSKNLSNIFLVARYCAPESYDHTKLSRHVNKRLEKVGYADLNWFYGILYDKIINKKINATSLTAFPPTIANYMEHFEKTSDKLLIDARITNFPVFFKFLSLLKQRYANLTTILVIGNPLAYYNSFCHSRASQARINSSNYFFYNNLFRLDQLIYGVENIIGKEKLFTAVSNSRRENEKSVFSLTGLDYTEELAALPFPFSFKGQELNRFSGLPTWLDIYPFEDWRKKIAEWEVNNSLQLARSAEAGNFRQLKELADKYGKYLKQKLPALPQLLDNMNLDAFINAPPYAPLSASDIESFVNIVPQDIKNEIKKSFEVIKRGLPEFYQPFFRHLDGQARIQVGEDLSIPKCSVVTFTYNHEKYIAQCMDSVAGQVLDCSIEHIIVDDASTDATPQIIREYARKFPHIKPILFVSKPPNPVMTGFQSCKSQYVALCDGDDYFSDKHKLKTQIDFLDNHPDSHLCFHLTEVFHEDGSPSYIYPPQNILPGGLKPILTIDDLLQGNLMQTSSVMYRWRFRNGLPAWFNPNLQPGDWYWHLLHAELGNVGFIPKVMSRYRRHSNAVYATADKDTILHRSKYGMKELELYQHCDEHFAYKYHSSFSKLATGVLANFTQLFSSTNNSDLLDLAAANYPAFTQDFLTSLQNLNKTSTAIKEKD